MASVWDMQDGTEIGTVSTDVSGTSVLIGAVALIVSLALLEHRRARTAAA